MKKDIAAQMGDAYATRIRRTMDALVAEHGGHPVRPRGELLADIEVALNVPERHARALLAEHARKYYGDRETARTADSVTWETP